MIKVSVVMPAYGNETYVGEAITSILNQTFMDFELIIVYDEITDTARALINSFNDMRIKLIENTQREGLATSLNQGIARANGEYIARHDSDDISSPGRLEKQVKYLDAHPEVAVLGTSVYIIDGDGKRTEFRPASPAPDRTLMKGNKLNHGSVMLRKTVIESVGGYNACKEVEYAEDYELWLRIARQYKIRNLFQPLYNLRMHRGSICSSKAEQQSLNVIRVQRMAADITKYGCGYGYDANLDYNDLTVTEKIRFHNMVAYNYIQVNDIESARKEYTKISELRGFSIGNTLSIILSKFGAGGVLALYNTFRYMRIISYTILKIEI